MMLQSSIRTSQKTILEWIIQNTSTPIKQELDQNLCRNCEHPALERKNSEAATLNFHAICRLKVKSMHESSVDLEQALAALALRSGLKIEQNETFFS
jgi:hypothetical protein